MRRAIAALLAGTAACMVVSRAVYIRDPKLTQAIIRLAQPHQVVGETGDLAAAIDAAQHDKLPEARDKLIAWTRAHGLFAPPGDDPAIATSNACIAIGKILATYHDDDTLDTAVYAGMRMRDEGTGMVAAMCAVQLENKLISLRPTSKADWFDSRIDDADFERLVASEVAYEMERPGNHDWQVLDAFAAGVLAAHDLARTRGLPTTPAAWFPMEVTVHVVVTGHPAPALADYVRKWTPAQRAYNAWLDR
ncbi:MAG TPA: hypothetical protein VGG74_25695 [Kofleriaceae bacterium]|jgi:hypothetical protein